MQQCARDMTNGGGKGSVRGVVPSETCSGIRREGAANRTMTTSGSSGPERERERTRERGGRRRERGRENAR